MPSFTRSLLSVCLAAACIDGQAIAAEVAAAPADMRLKPSSGLTPGTPPGVSLKGPTFVEADWVRGHVGREIEAGGEAVVHNLRERLEGDWLYYDQPADSAHAKGRVLFTQDQDRVHGSELKLRLTERIGQMRDVRFELRGNPSPDGGRVDTARGEAASLNFEGVNRYALETSTYTTCPLESPDWLMHTKSLSLDYNTSLGAARHVWVEYMGVPFLYVPWLDFSLDKKRKSGFLAPTYGASDERGLELVTPWYWNIAPNRDATFTPRFMSKRGTQLGTEFRYLDRAYRGELFVDYLSEDRVESRARHFINWRHEHTLSRAWSLGVDARGVSDDRYFVDLSSLVEQTSLVNLPRQIEVRYAGDGMSARGLLLGYQTLQYAATPIFEPYAKLPQLTFSTGSRAALPNTWQWRLNSELVRFERDSDDAVQGVRLHANPSLSFPFQNAYASITPKIGWQLTHYALDEATVLLRDNQTSAPTGGFDSTTRSLPSFSLDAGFVLEREGDWLGRGYIQTLEPRLYYLAIPARDQSRIPVFDTGVGDLSMDQLFSENQYVGVDRINDARQMTMAVTSRFLEDQGGAERLAVTLAQRYYFTDQQVVYPGQVARTTDATDVLGLVSGQINRFLSFSSGFQVNTETGDLVKANIGGSWRDGPGRRINADYRFINRLYSSALEQFDVSMQWPLRRNLYAMARVNYSLLDTRLVEGLAGLEYNAGCWSLRGVLQRLATAENTSTNALFLQLELRGLTSLGPNPLEVLNRSISGYVKTDEYPLQ